MQEKRTTNSQSLVFPDVAEKPRRERILDPIDRNSEILFGLFMVLTFTGTLSVATAGKTEVRTMLIAAIGCNVAWGIVNGVMYVLRSFLARGRQAALARAVLAASRAEDGQRLIAAEIGLLSASLDAKLLELIRQWIVSQPALGTRPLRVTADELKGALAVFLLVFSATFLVVLPFLFIHDLPLAMRLSAAIALVVMFRCGYVWGQYVGLPPLRLGLGMVLVGIALEVIIIALGG